MELSWVLQLGFYFLVAGPIVAGLIAFKGSPPAATFARYYLLLAWLAYGAVTAWCLWTTFFVRSSGIGHGVFFIAAMPLGVIAGVLFSVWRAAHRHAFP